MTNDVKKKNDAKQMSQRERVEKRKKQNEKKQPFSNYVCHKSVEKKELNLALALDSAECSKNIII